MSSLNNLVGCVLAHQGQPLPPIASAYEYVIGRHALYVRAANPFITACIPLADFSMPLFGLDEVDVDVSLAVPRVPYRILQAIWMNAVESLPNESMYQLHIANDGWLISKPEQQANSTSLTFHESGDAVIDLHSHGNMSAFFSSTDDQDEKGFRIYAVIGNVNNLTPTISVRVGVYGHYHYLPATLIFESIGMFVDTFPQMEATDANDDREGDANPLYVARWGDYNV